jgi:hypothetical protein
VKKTNTLKTTALFTKKILVVTIKILPARFSTKSKLTAPYLSSGKFKSKPVIKGNNDMKSYAAEMESYQIKSYAEGNLPLSLTSSNTGSLRSKGATPLSSSSTGTFRSKLANELAMSSAGSSTTGEWKCWPCVLLVVANEQASTQAHATRE